MKKYILTWLSFCLFCIGYSQNDMAGTWQSIDDKDGQPTAYIDISPKSDGTYSGKIIKLFDVQEDTVCDLCSDDKKDKPLIGMEILWNLEEDGNELTGGRILDPENGKTYKCKVSLADQNTLKVRGYIGMPALGRTQTWLRVK